MNTIILSLLLITTVSFIVALSTTHAGVGGRFGSNTAQKTYIRESSNFRSPYALTGLGNEYERFNSVTKYKENSVKTKSARNISTLQIIFVLTLIMSLGFAGYYFIQFYPFICSKESKYDVMSRSSVTPTHSREFEYESASSVTKSTNASYSNEHDV
ncbi:CLUMA_CG000240, isoform A [Clunio marinus]|uniref:CLUMA_CG000240, isoform A n=1 Tax=Clunio marinus TaxID=568069 RepID=A0A1J1HF27_9DIPT|nr:CLUMA_CG000240, isoform A [Clunio marinus]